MVSPAAILDQIIRLSGVRRCDVLAGSMFTEALRQPGADLTIAGAGVRSLDSRCLAQRTPTSAAESLWLAASAGCFLKWQ